MKGARKSIKSSNPPARKPQVARKSATPHPRYAYIDVGSWVKKEEPEEDPCEKRARELQDVIDNLTAITTDLRKQVANLTGDVKDLSQALESIRGIVDALPVPADDSAQ